MRNLLALIGALVIGFAVAGWYLGWYQLGVTKTSDGNLHVETNVNTKKVAEDSDAALKKAGSFIGEHLDKTAQDVKAAPVPTPGTTPGPVDTTKNTGTRVSVFGVDLTPSAQK